MRSRAAGRHILSPCIACGTIVALRALGLLPPTAADPVLVFTLLLMSAQPPAQNSVLMLQVAGDREGATQLSRVLLLLYVLASVPLALLLSAFLQHVGL